MSTEDTTAVDRNRAVVRANAYHALAEAFSPPADWSATFPEDLGDALIPLGGELATLASSLVTAARDAMNHRESASVDHARLFLGPFEVLAAPWASLYLDPNQRLMGPASQYAAQAYSEAGLGPGASLMDVPDHIRHELEFMYYLAFEEATSDKIEWRERQRSFWGEHLGRWLPELAKAVRLADQDAYYRALADILLAFAEEEQTHL
jgi:TorA maturation chaperone TorD